jgi:Concanavalin A-like lectin/glucanases superfamily
MRACTLALTLLLWVVSAQADITSSLVAWYRLNEGTGSTANDSSDNAIHGTLASSTEQPTWVTTTCVPMSGPGMSGCLSFDGGDVVTLPTHASLNITGSITLAAWVQTSSHTTTVIGGYQNSGAFPGYGLRISPTAGRIGYYNGTSWAEANTAVTDGTWTHIAVSTAGSTASFYRNCTADGTPSSGVPNSYAGPRSLGAAEGGTGPYFVGSLKDVRIYNRALSSGDIVELCAFGRVRARTTSLQGLQRVTRWLGLQRFPQAWWQIR